MLQRVPNVAKGSQFILEQFKPMFDAPIVGPADPTKQRPSLYFFPL
jgi:hypothetical protein